MVTEQRASHSQRSSAQANAFNFSTLFVRGISLMSLFIHPSLFIFIFSLIAMSCFSGCAVFFTVPLVTFYTSQCFFFLSLSLFFLISCYTRRCQLKTWKWSCSRTRRKKEPAHAKPNTHEQIFRSFTYMIRLILESQIHLTLYAPFSTHTVSL